MLGAKLRIWMEARIARSRKKKDRKKGEKGFDSNRDSPKSRESSRSPAFYQVHPIDSATKSVDGIRSARESGRCGTASASSATSACTGSVSLSSPESAYSTGYSTDGTSPGTSYPPEYYINIRTGTHYFQSTANAIDSNQNDNHHHHSSSNNNNNNNSNTCNNNNSTGSRSKRAIGASPLSPAALPSGRRHGTLDDPADSAALAPRDATMDHEPSNGPRRSAQSKITDGTRSQRARPSPAQRERCHRQAESFSADSSRSNLAGPALPPPSLLSPTTQSPRERSRIRTNPWLATASSGSCAATFKRRPNLAESSGSASDVNASTAREGRTRRESKQESLSAGRSPINQNWRITSGMEIRPKIALSVQRRDSNTSSTSSTTSSRSSTTSNDSNDSNGTNDRSCSGSSGTSGNGNGNGNGNGRGNGGSSATSITRSGRSSEDDVTLNEMMGKFDESYVYEKETDILSDSDPTDCEDCIGSLSDADAARDIGDENELLADDDLDYIDDGSLLDLEDLDYADRFPNTGHCTYYAFPGELARRTSRLRESLLKRRSREDAATMHRTIGAKTVARKQLLPVDKRKRKASQRRKSSLEKREQGPRGRVEIGADAILVDADEEAGNLNRVLVERMLLKNSGFNQGSRSVGGTPICMRRKRPDLDKPASPMRSRGEQPAALRASVARSEIVDKRRSNSVSYANGNVARRGLAASTTAGAYATAFASEIALIEADKEADKKYRELILEAESILANMQKSHSSGPIVPSPSRKLHYGLANKRVELIKNTELNIELALSKSRNSQPELQSGSIRDLEHTSPKRQQLLLQPASPLPRFRSASIHRASPLVARRVAPLPDGDAIRSPRPPIFDRSDVFSPVAARRVAPRPPPAYHATALSPRTSPGPASHPDLCSPGPPVVSASTGKEEGVTSSSSDSDERCDVRRRPPLMTFRSVDMGPIKEGSSYCPQSEPVKRKVYAGSATYGRIQKSLGEPVTLRNSDGDGDGDGDGDTATDPDTDDSRRSLKEKVAKLRQERLGASPNSAAQDSQIFQQQLTQLRRQMLMQTIQGLKQSLEDQSATLKQACLEPMMADRLP